MRETESSYESIGGVDPLRVYLRDITRYPLMTKEEEFTAWEGMQPGMAALERLNGQDHDQIPPEELAEMEAQIQEYQQIKSEFVNRNLRLVVSLAKKYQHIAPLLDLIQEGNIGLAHAVDKFDARKGYKFSTYATWWVKQAIKRGGMPQSYDRSATFPVYIEARISRIDAARTSPDLTPEQRQQIEHVAVEAGLSEHEIKESDALVARFGGRLSLNETLGEGTETERGDLVGDDRAEDPEEAAQREAIRDIINDVLEDRSILTCLQADAVRLYYAIGHDEQHNYIQIGQILGINRETARKNVQKAREKLARHLRSLS